MGIYEHMILIIDSGSTKADWALVSKIGYEVYKTHGFNAATQDDTSLEIPTEVRIQKAMIDKVYFFGAGIHSSGLKEKVVQLLQPNFLEHTTIEVASDLVAAAKAIWHDGSGLIGILGTGSQAGYYNGLDVEVNVPSLGYIFSDEGSGSALGKWYLKAFFYGTMPLELQEHFRFKYPNISIPTVLEAIYKQHKGSAYIAQFASVFAGIEHDWLRKTQVAVFRAFFEDRVRPNVPQHCNEIGLVGSIAHIHQTCIAEVASSFSLQLVKTIQSPMDGLIPYYQQKL